MQRIDGSLNIGAVLGQIKQNPLRMTWLHNSTISSIDPLIEGSTGQCIIKITICCLQNVQTILSKRLFNKVCTSSQIPKWPSLLQYNSDIH